ncbi:hypothetical protein D9619_012072 [Psilocybe cf. subviscida]|uniref:Uncharacterized protein n=1 Tax=Psilocybe cf. subviscida TaxID=2480587 RepID=A0A8H5EZI3_9AGAR|nr:hypothetical protein D9619_012072 [Psilocybe cf. subviscida]
MSEYPAGVPSNLFDVGDSFIISLFPSTAAYGANIALSFAFMSSLVHSRFKRTRVESLAYGIYVLALMALATHATVYNVQSLISNVVFKHHAGNSNVGLPVSLPLVVLMTNCFMFWWCFNLYRTTPKTPRAFVNALLSVFIFLNLGSVILFLYKYPSMQNTDYWTLGNINNLDHYYDLVTSLDGSIFIFFAVTAGINIAITIIITARLIGIHKSIVRSRPKSSGDHFKPSLLIYVDTMGSFFIKSNFLSTIVALTVELSFSTHFQSNANMNIPRVLSPQISVLSILLLIRRMTAESTMHPM